MPEASEQTEKVNAVMTITGFADLEESITNQQLAIGAGEEEIVFPDTLDVTVSVSVSDETSETEENETSETENVETKEITLTDITWKLNPAESDGEVFGSSAECDGYCYVYTPVIPEKDEEGNNLVLGEDVELSAIYVLIGSGEDHVSQIAESSGTCGDNLTWKLEDGTLTIYKTNADSEDGEMMGFGFSSVKPWDSNKDIITAVVIKDGVTLIGKYAFKQCSSLTSVEIPSSVKTIGRGAFYGCSSLTSVTFKEGSQLKTIDANAFVSCTSLASIEIPSSVNMIGMGAFDSCTSLTSIEIPSSVTTIGESPFAGCTSLSSISVDGENENYSSSDGVLFDKDYTELIYYPARKTDTSYNIPENVTTIGASAFYGCSNLTSIEIPNSVTTIGAVAFCECENLKDVIYGGSKSQWEGISVWELNDCLTNANITYTSFGGTVGLSLIHI